MKPIVTTLLLAAISTLSLSQVEVDRTIDLTGSSDADRAIHNLAMPENDYDAANKKYVDEQIASQSGSSGPVIGELYEGGVVAAVYKDAQGDSRGLVVSLVNNSNGIEWSNVIDMTAGASSPWDGASNSSIIMNQSGHTFSAAKVCDDYTGGGKTDWFLPSLNQLNKVWTNLYEVHQTLAATPGAELMEGSDYWSSTENHYLYARRVNFLFGDVTNNTAKTDSRMVRCVRVF